MESVKKAFHICVHAPIGGGGKTIESREISSDLASRGYKVLLIGVCFSNQMTLLLNSDKERIVKLSEEFLFNVKGLFDFTQGIELAELAKEIEPNLHFLPGGNLPEVEYYLRQRAEEMEAEEDHAREEGKDVELKSKTAWLEECFSVWDDYYDFVIHDTAPNHNTHLFYNILYMSNCIISPVETQKKSSPLLKLFQRYLEQVNHEFRELYGKPPINIDFIVPNRYKRNVKVHQKALSDMNAAFPGKVLDPIHDCASFGELWETGESFMRYTSERLQRELRVNERLSLNAIKHITDSVVALAKERGFNF